MTTALAELSARLPELMLRDERRLQRRLDGARKVRDPAARQTRLAGIEADVEAAERRIRQRRAGVPVPTYPEALPVSGRKDDILAAIRDHQVVILAGETGSGKTTQLPKICLELGRGVRGLIGHTQPRRLAARTVAERIAEELGTPLGSAVGYKVRFSDHVGDGTLVKLMTDGILLAEIQSDRLLSQYDTLIIDEAHERSLNIDFLLGYLKQLLPRRPDLKVVITSATIDPDRFARHFDDAPVVEVSGRTYPVEVRYRPLVRADAGDEDRDQVQAICDAVDELRGAGPGDVLVFLSGEREIRDAADALRGLEPRRAETLEVVPLYSRLSAAEQHRVFQPHAGRRVVLATNVAETSLTVPGIRYVVDPGTARISRYSNRTKVQRLPIEAVSQASADQRKGRCGRLSDGICIRLYAEDDFLSRPEFTDPEILRTNLASVILAMTALGLGDIAAFPFLDPPDRRNVTDGVQLLEELGALDPAEQDPRRRLTALGRKLAQLPVDPRMARMVLEADRNGCVSEVMVIAAALSIQDPRERPVEHQQAAAQLHARFADEDSDFLAYLNLWNHLQEQQKSLSSNQFRRMCKAEFLSYLRIREWQDLYSQLREVGKTLGLSSPSGLSPDRTPADRQRVHVSLLAGLLSHIGLKGSERQEYVGARNARFAVFPGSALFKKPPPWVMAAELVETSRLWGRVVARIEPEWAESLAGHLVKRSYSEPHWESKRGAVMGYERVTLYGVPLVTARKVGYGRIDPQLSRELFIRHALVEGDWRTHHQFFHDNLAVLAEAEEIEHRVRRRGIVVDDETLFDFYDARVGDEVVSARHFDSWWKKVRRTQPDLLSFSTSMMMNHAAGAHRPEDYPESLQQHGLRLPVSYRFEPGAADDGVTVDVPLPLLSRISEDAFDWQVPGLRHELVTSLIRSLPKQLRRNFVPAPDYAKAVLQRVSPDEPLLDAVGRELRRLTGVVVPRDSWQLDRVPGHLRPAYRVVDKNSKVLAQSKDLPALKQQLAGEVRAVIAEAADSIERVGLRSWSFGTLPRTFQRGEPGHAVRGFPALVDEGDSIAIRVLATESEQRSAMWRGTRRLLRLTVPSPVRAIQRRLPGASKLALSHNPYGGVAELVEDCVSCAVDSLMGDHGGPAWDEGTFDKLRDRVAAELDERALEVLTLTEDVLTAGRDVERRLSAAEGQPVVVAGRPAVAASSLATAASLADLRAQLAALVYRGFVSATGWRRLPHLPRYLRAMERRLESLPREPERDRARMGAVHEVQQAYDQLCRDLPPAARDDDAVRDVRWMVEELRVSYFAQTLGTPGPVSEKRIYRAMDVLLPG